MDDEKILWKLIGSLLHRLGYEVDSAENGEQAISLFKKADNTDQPYSALLLDLTIRGGPGGKEVLQQIDHIDAAAKAVALSGFSNEPVFEDYRTDGFVGALKKPFKTKRFIEVMSRVLNLPRSPDS